MDRPGVRQVPEGSGEQGKMEKTSSKIICGAQTTLAVKELLMLLMLNICNDFMRRTISLISNPSKVMLKIIPDRLKSSSGEDHCFRSGRSTAEQIFNLRFFYEKYLKHRLLR
ncbi:hypothetical protein, partial [Thiolapillus sp.]|uniref:hypothetical protein n=1 Tax=Thiolapillus sp. TaxID=2017437 RepID=UPI003AF6E228